MASAIALKGKWGWDAIDKIRQFEPGKAQRMSARACKATYGDRCADRGHTPTSSSCPPLAGARDRRFLMRPSNCRDSLSHKALKLFHVPLLLPLGSSLSLGPPSLRRHHQGEEVVQRNSITPAHFQGVSASDCDVSSALATYTAAAAGEWRETRIKREVLRDPLRLRLKKSARHRVGSVAVGA